MVDQDCVDFAMAIASQTRQEIVCALHLLELSDDVSQWRLSHPGAEVQFHVDVDSLQESARHLLANAELNAEQVTSNLEHFMKVNQEGPHV